MRTANFRTIVLCVCLFAVNVSYGQKQAYLGPPRPVSRFDSISRTYKHIVGKAYVLYLDSTYRAKGYNDARHMAYMPKEDTTNTRSRPSAWPLIYAELERDSLLTKENMSSFTLEFKGEVMSIRNVAQSPEVSKKYLDIYNKFNKEHPAPPRFADPDEYLIKERTFYITNRIELELLNDKIVNDGDTLSYQLDNDGLIVNGEHQPVEIHQKYFDLFVKTMPKGRMRWTLK